MPQVLATAGLFIALISLLFTLQCWIANSYRPDRAIRLLGYSTLCAAIGVPLVLIRPPVPEIVAISAGNALNFLALGLSWQAAACIFNRKRSPLWLLAIPGVWLALCLSPWFLLHRDDRIIIGTALASILVTLTVFELMREPVQTSAHRALRVIGPCHLICAIGGTVSVIRPALIPWETVVIFGMPFETLAYIVLWSGLTLTLIAEKAIITEQERAMHDELSGALNRRGFWVATKALKDPTILLLTLTISNASMIRWDTPQGMPSSSASPL